MEAHGKEAAASFNDAECKQLEVLGLNQTDIAHLAGIATNAMVGTARKGGKASSFKNEKNIGSVFDCTGNVRARRRTGGSFQAYRSTSEEEERCSFSSLKESYVPGDLI